MSADDDSGNAIERLLRAVSEGASVDWDEPLSTAQGEERERIVSLRDLATIASFHRDLHRTGADDAQAERWGDFVLLERIGGGAHADVYRAWDPGLRREVAVKRMRASSPRTADPSSMREEARAIARVRHPNVVTVHGVEEHDDRWGLVMEYVRGTDLERLVEGRGALSVVDVVRLGREVGAALAAVHAQGLLHRDVKPANVIRDEQGRHVLVDFGLGVRSDGVGRATLPSGTPMYMAPEVLAGAAPTPRSEVYALGMVLVRALTGRQPFDVATLDALTKAAATGPPRSVRAGRPDVPRPLDAIVRRAVAPNPADRFERVDEMVGALERLSAPRPLLGRVRRVAVLVAASAIVAFFAMRNQASVYDVDASLLRRDEAGIARLASGDRVALGDRISLRVRASRETWIYVLNEDEVGQRFLLFPQPSFDLANPLPADTELMLPGTIAGQENAWTITSRGGREHFLVVASPRPIPEIEADLARIPAPEPGRAPQYATVGDAAVERLRGAGGLVEVDSRRGTDASSDAFEHFRDLSGRERVHGVWVRHVVLENPEE
jgi:tRNA A-37 threonylcarbamoyl transferase component Bud32